MWCVILNTGLLDGTYSWDFNGLMTANLKTDHTWQFNVMAKLNSFFHFDESACYDMFMNGHAGCHDKDISNNVTFALKMT